MKENHKKILQLIFKFKSGLSTSEKKSIHFKSVRNFVFHLIENQKYKKGANKELQRLGEERMIILLLNYLKTIDESKLEKIPDYKEYVQKIGAFMIKYYGFSYSGGKILYFKLFLSITLGMLLDFVILLFFGEVFYLFTTVFSIRYLIITVLKYKNKKVFGYFY